MSLLSSSEPIAQPTLHALSRCASLQLSVLHKINQHVIKIACSSTVSAKVGLQYLHKQRELNSEGIISQCSCVRVKWVVIYWRLSVCVQEQLDIEKCLTPKHLHEKLVLLSPKQVQGISNYHKEKLYIPHFCQGVCNLVVCSVSLNNSHSYYKDLFQQLLWQTAFHLFAYF